MSARAISNWLLLYRMQIASWRDGWVWSVCLSALSPLSLLWFLHFSGGAASPERVVHAISGSVIFAVVLNTTLGLGQELSTLRAGGALDFYVTLPISRGALVFAILGRAMTFALPSVITVFTIGSLTLGLRVGPHALWAVPVLLLAAFSLSAAGAAVGFLSPSQKAASFLTQVGYTLVVFFTPIMLPIEALPEGLRAFAWLIPTTYAARALRMLLSPHFNAVVLTVDLTVLAAFAALSIVLIRRHLIWRQD